MAAKGKEEKPFDSNPLVDNIKYGDADLSSKRRKPDASFEEDEEEHEENTTYLKFETNVSESCFQSSFIDKTANTSKAETQTIPVTANKAEKTLKSQDFKSSAKYNCTITDKPAVSSKGFDNTFKLLQNQIKINTEKIVDLLKIINADQKCSLAVRAENSLAAKVEEEPTCFELQLEALERVQNYFKNIKDISYEEKKSLPLLELLYKFLSKGVLADAVDDLAQSSIQADCLRKDTIFNRQLIYYAGKNVSGAKCLKIVRNMLNKDEGTFKIHFVTPAEFKLNLAIGNSIKWKVFQI